MRALVEVWRTLNLERGSYTLAEDVDVIRSDLRIYHPTYAEYMRHGDFDPEDTRFHVGLLPMPYTGDLQTATIFLLIINPGLRYWERKFHQIAEVIREKRGCSYQDALGLLSRHVAGLELIPYHSP